jgi:hypothetical protein
MTLSNVLKNGLDRRFNNAVARKSLNRNRLERTGGAAWFKSDSRKLSVPVEQAKLTLRLWVIIVYCIDYQVATLSPVWSI